MSEDTRGIVYQFFAMLCVIIIAALLCIIIVVLKFQRDQSDAQCKEYAQIYKWKQGYTSFYGKDGLNYQLFSFNSGKTWYAVKDEKILGEADKVYPGLLTELDNWEKYEAWLMARPKDAKLTEKDIEYLKTIGFTITIGPD